MLTQEQLDEFFNSNVPCKDKAVYKEAIHAWIHMNPDKEFREPDKEDQMEEVIALIKEKDRRWTAAKGRHKKSSMKAYKYIYDQHNNLTNAYDKNKVTSNKASAKKSSVASSAPHEPKPQENNKRVLAGHTFKPDGSVSPGS